MSQSPGSNASQLVRMACACVWMPLCQSDSQVDYHRPDIPAEPRQRRREPEHFAQVLCCAECSCASTARGAGDTTGHSTQRKKSRVCAMAADRTQARENFEPCSVMMAACYLLWQSSGTAGPSRHSVFVGASGHEDVAGRDIISNHEAVIYRELRCVAAEENLLLIEQGW